MSISDGWDQPEPICAACGVQLRTSHRYPARPDRVGAYLADGRVLCHNHALDLFAAQFAWAIQAQTGAA